METTFKLDFNKRKNEPNGNIIAQIDGIDYIFCYSADDFAKDPYGIIFPNNDIITMINRDKTALKIYKKISEKLNIFKNEKNY